MTSVADVAQVGIDIDAYGWVAMDDTLQYINYGPKGDDGGVWLKVAGPHGVRVLAVSPTRPALWNGVRQATRFGFLNCVRHLRAGSQSPFLV